MMTAFLIATVKVKNPEKLQEYIQGVGPTMAVFGGEPVARGQLKDALVGVPDHQMAAVVKFPDAEQAQAWYMSEAYAALKPIREEAADVTMTIYAAPPA